MTVNFQELFLFFYNFYFLKIIFLFFEIIFLLFENYFLFFGNCFFTSYKNYKNRIHKYFIIFQDL